MGWVDNQKNRHRGSKKPPVEVIWWPLGERGKARPFFHGGCHNTAGGHHWADAVPGVPVGRVYPFPAFVLHPVRPLPFPVPDIMGGIVIDRNLATTPNG